MRTFEVYGPEYSEIRQGQNIMHALLASSIPASQIKMIEDVQIREAVIADSPDPSDPYQDKEADGVVFCGKCGARK